MSIAELNTDVALFKRSRTKVTEVNDAVNEDNEFSPEDVTDIHEQLGFPKPPSSTPKEVPDYNRCLRVLKIFEWVNVISAFVFLCVRLLRLLFQ
jgi:hypothetical protein